MWFVVGLGNPGSEYETTRHNAGFRFVDAWAENNGATWQHMPKLKAEVAKQDDWIWLKPQTFMNESGWAVRAVLNFFAQFDKQSPKTQKNQLNHLLIVHDDLDIVFGQMKLQFGKGPKVHNGLRSLYQHLGTSEFWHGRIGIDGRGGLRTIPGRNYVLQSWTVEEQFQLVELEKKLPELWSDILKQKSEMGQV